MAQRDIEWKYITERAPWQGVIYERMAGLVKSTYCRSIGRNYLTAQQLLTTLAEAEAIVNARPLTYVSKDSLQILRPVDFLSPSAEIKSPVFEPDDGDENYSPHQPSAKERLLQ